MRTFYILLTDAECKIANNYGVSSMTGAADILNENNVNVSVVTGSSYYNHYKALYSTTGGINADIYGNFSQTLLNKLIPIIYEDVIS